MKPKVFKLIDWVCMRQAINGLYIYAYFNTWEEAIKYALKYSILSRRIK